VNEIESGDARFEATDDDLLRCASAFAMIEDREKADEEEHARWDKLRLNRKRRNGRAVLDGKERDADRIPSDIKECKKEVVGLKDEAADWRETCQKKRLRRRLKKEVEELKDEVEEFEQEEYLSGRSQLQSLVRADSWRSF
jgi:tRNA G10  N-methylase Trm11